MIVAEDFEESDLKLLEKGLDLMIVNRINSEKLLENIFGKEDKTTTAARQLFLEDATILKSKLIKMRRRMKEQQIEEETNQIINPKTED